MTKVRGAEHRRLVTGCHEQAAACGQAAVVHNDLIYASHETTRDTALLHRSLVGPEIFNNFSLCGLLHLSAPAFVACLIRGQCRTAHGLCGDIARQSPKQHLKARFYPIHVHFSALLGCHAPHFQTAQGTDMGDEAVIIGPSALSDRLSAQCPCLI